jgi:hypothetical protein
MREFSLPCWVPAIEMDFCNYLDKIYKRKKTHLSASHNQLRYSKAHRQGSTLELKQ